MKSFLIKKFNKRIFKPQKNEDFDTILKIFKNKYSDGDYFTTALNGCLIILFIALLNFLINLFLKISSLNIVSIILLFLGGLYFYWIYFDTYFNYRFKLNSELLYAPLIIEEIVRNLEFYDSIEKSLKEIKGFQKNLFLKNLISGLNSKTYSFIDFFQKKLIFFSKFDESLKRFVFSFGLAFKDSSKKSRLRFLERSVKDSLNDLVEKIDGFSSSLQMPTLIIFSFGVILPLIIFSSLPFILLTYNATTLINIMLLLIGLVFVTYFYSNFVLLKRPLLPTFTLIDFKPELKKSLYLLSIGVFFSFLIGFFFILFDFGFVGLIFSNENFWVFGVLIIYNAFGCFLGYFFYSITKKDSKIINTQQSFRNYFTDLVQFISIGLSNGLSLEKIVLNLSDLNNPFKKYFKKAKKLITVKGLSLEKSFKKIFKPPIFTGFTLDFLNFLSHGSNFNSLVLSKVLFSVSDFYSKLLKIHKNFLNKTANTIGMLKFTVFIITPFIMSFSLVLSKVLFNSFTGLDLSFFGLNTLTSFPFFLLLIISYSYLLLFGLVITRFSSYMVNGFNKYFWFKDLSIFFPTVSFIYSLSLLISSKLFGVF